MQEKSFREIEDDYKRRKLEAQGSFHHGHWDKCSMCNGIMSIPCDNCRGTGRMLGQPKRVNSATPPCGATTRPARCARENASLNAATRNATTARCGWRNKPFSWRTKSRTSQC